MSHTCRLVLRRRIMKNDILWELLLKPGLCRIGYEARIIQHCLWSQNYAGLLLKPELCRIASEARIVQDCFWSHDYAGLLLKPELCRIASEAMIIHHCFWSHDYAGLLLKPGLYTIASEARIMQDCFWSQDYPGLTLKPELCRIEVKAENGLQLNWMAFKLATHCNYIWRDLTIYLTLIFIMRSGSCRIDYGDGVMQNGFRIQAHVWLLLKPGLCRNVSKTRSMHHWLCSQGYTGFIQMLEPCRDDSETWIIQNCVWSQPGSQRIKSFGTFRNSDVVHKPKIQLATEFIKMLVVYLFLGMQCLQIIGYKVPIPF